MSDKSIVDLLNKKDLGPDVRKKIMNMAEELAQRIEDYRTFLKSVGIPDDEIEQLISDEFFGNMQQEDVSEEIKSQSSRSNTTSEEDSDATISDIEQWDAEHNVRRNGPLYKRRRQ